MCSAHRIALAEAARPKAPIEVIGQTISDFLSGRPINHEQTLGAVRDIASQWSGNIGSGYRPDIRSGESEGSAHRRAQAGDDPLWNWILNANARFQSRNPEGTPPPPSPSPEEVIRARKMQAARRIFGFREGVVLTEEAIKKRYRELVKRAHPDHGGSTERTAIINAARDVLVASLHPAG